MNLSDKQTDSKLTYVSFNQDNSSLEVGRNDGYTLYTFTSVENLEKHYENDTEGVIVIERLFSSSLLAIVSARSPRKLKVCHFKKGTEICNYSYSNAILAVRLNRQRLVVCLEESLYIHNIRDMKVLHTIRDTPPNLSGVCALSTNNDNSFLAYPGSSQIGEVQIFDVINLKAVTMIQAHNNPLAAITFNSQGNKIATASEKGTVIRVFSVAEGQKLYEFRRSVKRCAVIYSLSFSLDSTYLCCSSNTETVHVFKLEPADTRTNEDSQTWMGIIGQALKTTTSYLPTQVSDMLSQGRDFAVARLPFSKVRSVCSIVSVDKLPYLLVASENGLLYVYNLGTAEGGECTLFKNYRIDGRPDVQVPLGDGTDMHPDTLQTQCKDPFSDAPQKIANKRQESCPPGDKESPRHSIPGHSYASALKNRTNGPQDCQTEDEVIIWEDCRQDADDSSDADALRLNDDNEFPPMMHRLN